MKAGMTGGMAENRKRKRQKAEQTGRRAEWLAAVFLMLKGFAILERRLKNPAGEIDLVARRGKLVILVEVKARPRLDDAVEAVGPRNRSRICAAANMHLSRNPALAECMRRYDIIAVAGWRLRHIPDAWRDRGYMN